MLPPELVDEICTHLDFKDIVSLCQADRDLISEPAMRRVLLKECPCFDIKYSQWDDWRSSAIGYLSVGSDRFQPTLECPVYVNQPLPLADFHCLCKDLNLNGSFAYNDMGVFLGDKFLDLTESPVRVVPSSCSPPKKPHLSMFGDAVTYDKQMMRVRGKIVSTICTPQVMAVAFCNNDGQLIISMKDVSNGETQNPVFGCHIPGQLSYKMQVVGKTAIVAAVKAVNEYSCIIAQDKPTVNAERRYPVLKPPAGLLFYDGHVFDVTIDSRWKPVVQSSMSTEPPPKEWAQSKYHRVEQDSRYLQYGLIYNEDGLVTALVDLKTHQLKELTDTSDVPRDDSHPIHEYLTIVGVHKGSIGVWRYTKGFLMERYRQLHREDAYEEDLSALT